MVINAFDEGETVMRGPTILARSMSIATQRGKSLREWQYHSRSDSHSKVACWTLLFDLLHECDAIRTAAEQGRLGFGINHTMRGAINKKLDLVLTVLPASQKPGKRATFAFHVSKWGVALSDEDRAALGRLPVLHAQRSDDISEVAIAIEAKACMTEHVKSLPRLHAEILATGYLAKRASPNCISAAYTLVNAAPTFVTPSAKSTVNRHKQPDAARRVVEMLSQAVPTASDSAGYGYDAIGTTVIDCRNDGSQVLVIHDDPAPSTTEHTHYEQMVVSLGAAFRQRFRF